MQVRLMTKHLRRFCRVWTDRQRVMERLRVVDPDGRKPKPPGRWWKRHAAEAAAREAMATAQVNESTSSDSEDPNEVSLSQRVPQNPQNDPPDEPEMNDMAAIEQDHDSHQSHQSQSTFLSNSQNGPQEPINSMAQQMERLSADNNYLRSQNQLVMDQNASLRAELRRLASLLDISASSLPSSNSIETAGQSIWPNPL